MSATVKLRVGTITGGVLTPGSMAAAIYDALVAQVPLGAAEDPIGRQRLAVAIATGVIGHLQAQQEAFVVNVRDGGGSAIERTVRIDVG